jgi:predicted amino acid racemase
MTSEAARAVALADWSLLSEPATARALSDAAVKAGRTHGVIAMLELGDLREGCPDEAALFALARAVVSLPGLKLEGVGANFICYGGVVPSHENLARLVNAREGLEARLGVRIPWVSGGGSYTERLLASAMCGRRSTTCYRALSRGHRQWDRRVTVSFEPTA